jgi:hypothetical protein
MCPFVPQEVALSLLQSVVPLVPYEIVLSCLRLVFPFVLQRVVLSVLQESAKQELVKRDLSVQQSVEQKLV